MRIQSEHTATISTRPLQTPSDRVGSPVHSFHFPETQWRAGTRRNQGGFELQSREMS
jgi:hypothetical protein